MGKYWFRVEKNDFFCLFSRFWTFYNHKKHDLSEKNNIRLTRADAGAVPVELKICIMPPPFLRARKLKFRLLPSFEPT
jgi:hypothetical protein